MFLLLFFPTILFACGDVCNEDDGAYVMSTFPNVAPEPTCASGYTRFSRVGYNWCLAMHNTNLLNFTDAAKACTADGAVPSGYKNTAEQNWIVNQAIYMQNQNGYTHGGVWLGLHIRIGCTNTGFADDANCGTNSFEWTDGYTTGSSQILWGQSAPLNPPTYECAIMAAYVYDEAVDEGVYCLPTQVENYNCSAVTGTYAYETVRTIVCGKPPDQYN